MLWIEGVSVAMSESIETSCFARRMLPARAVVEVEVWMSCRKIVKSEVQVTSNERVEVGLQSSLPPGDVALRYQVAWKLLRFDKKVAQR